MQAPLHEATQIEMDAPEAPAAQAAAAPVPAQLLKTLHLGHAQPGRESRMKCAHH